MKERLFAHGESIVEGVRCPSKAAFPGKPPHGAFLYDQMLEGRLRGTHCRVGIVRESQAKKAWLKAIALGKKDPVEHCIVASEITFMESVARKLRWLKKTKR